MNHYITLLILLMSFFAIAMHNNKYMTIGFGILSVISLFFIEDKNQGVHKR